MKRSAGGTGCMRRGRWVLGLVALGACTSEPPDEQPVDSELAVDTEVEFVPQGDRPLCRERGPVPTFAPELVAWAEDIVDSVNRFYGEQEWRALEALGGPLEGTADRVTMTHLERGWSRLKFDDAVGAIEDFEAAEAKAIAGAPQWRGRARELLGVAWMRKAETDNCLTSGGADACIVPFNEGGYHADPSGMESAAAAFERSLVEDDPDSLSVRWLLNVTYMARGLWPDAVPEAWRLPAGLLDSEGTAQAWRNHAPSLRMSEPTGAGGAAVEDFDGDGLLDLLVSSIEPDVGMALWLNEGDGGFCEASRPSGVASVPGVLGFSVADYDNDGDIDVFAPRAGWMALHGSVRGSLLRNDGEGRFTDVTHEAGMADPDTDGPSQVAAWADFDGDGWLDLFVGREDDETVAIGRRVSSLYHNQGDGTFVDIAARAGVASAGFVKGANWGDIDGDGDPDLVVSNWKGPNRVFDNQGDLTFVDRAAALGFFDPRRSFATAVLDYDQDGLSDVFVAAFTNSYGGGGPLDPSYFESAQSFLNDKLGVPTDPLYSETAHLYRNTGETLVDVTEVVGLDDVHATMGLSFGDLNMDGWPDLLLATGAPEYDALEPNTAYLNEGGQRFLDVTTATRLGHLQKGHGVSFGDVDEDGDQDLLVEMGGAFRGDRSPNTFFVNPTNSATERVVHGVTLRLEGVTSNRSAIGARVEVVTPGRSFWAVVGESGSFGNNSLQLEMGLGDENAITRVLVQWPGGDLETIEGGVEVDHVVNLRQGEGVVASRPYQGFQVYWTDNPPPHDPHDGAP
jgi:hypothetical protein